MISFILGLIIGSMIGIFLISALILAGEEEEEKRYEKQDK